MSTEPPPLPRQPPMFWLGVGGAAALLVGLGSWVASSRAPAGVGVVVGLGLVGVIFAGFALSVRGRHRRVRAALPDAIPIPIVVGAELAAATARLSLARSQPGLELRRSTYAAIAINAAGLHLVTDAVRPDRVIDARSVTVSGVGRSMSGSRLTNCLLIDVHAEDSSITLPVIPMRLRNPLRTFSTHELEAVAKDLRSALDGEAVTPDWPY